MLDLLFSDSRALIQDILAWSICAAALIWGGEPEKAAALVWIVFFEFLAAVYTVTTGAQFQAENLDTFFAAIDIMAAVCWITIALFANRNYTLWIAAMQVLAMTAHLARGLVEAISPLAYVTMVAVPGWLQLVFLAAGIACHAMRERKHGKYRDWRLSEMPVGITSTVDARRAHVALNQPSQPSWRGDLK